ncbi:anaphase-promoting complex subunit 1-like, partial [Helianthus annuus]|uniref:anaphase-promoting complex subunit 1-like n=1 Tax=Helianthus annuus TaxID=4232 RepID=UPI000B903B47
MSDDDEEQVDGDTNMFDSGLDVSDSMGFGLPTEIECSLMEWVRQELKHELKQSCKQCLRRYVLQGQAPTAFQDMKVVGLADAIEGRVNVILHNGQMLRCTFRIYPSSSLANDCIAGMAEGLEANLYNHFTVLLWGNCDSTHLTWRMTWHEYQAYLILIVNDYSAKWENVRLNILCL